MAIIPDTKDWTWVLRRPCDECGFDPARTRSADVGDHAMAALPRWSAALERADAAVRPTPQVWSPVEYACHVRDMLDLFGQRVRLMCEEDGPTFANWDQDEAAVSARYDQQDAEDVSRGLARAAASFAAELAQVADWSRPGRRDNGAEFTIDTLVVYGYHDFVHHLVDVGG